MGIENNTRGRSRRSVLATTGGILTLSSLGGCNGGGKKYSLSAYDVDGDSLASALRWSPHDEEEAKMLDRLIDGEEVEMIASPLTNTVEWGGTTRALTRFVERDGTYYRLRIEETEEITIDRWVFWLDKIDGEPPTDATVISEPQDSFSDLDTTAFDYAISSTTNHGTFLDPDEARPRVRGWIFEKGTTENSRLVPDPPFTHVKVTIGSGGNQRTAYYAARSQKLSIETVSYTYIADPVAESAEEFRRYVDRELIQASFGPEDLSEGEKEIMDELVGGAVTGIHAESTPLSKSFESLLKRFDLLDNEVKGDYTAYSQVFFEYDSSPYWVSLRIDK